MYVYIPTYVYIHIYIYTIIYSHTQPALSRGLDVSIHPPNDPPPPINTHSEHAAGIKAEEAIVMPQDCVGSHPPPAPNAGASVLAGPERSERTPDCSISNTTTVLLVPLHCRYLGISSHCA